MAAMMAWLHWRTPDRCPMDATLLALDTSTETMALALLSPAGMLVRAEPGGSAASARLLPALMALLAEAGLSPRQLDGLAFGRGPGAFTGLRTACAVAQGLAFGLDLPLLPIDSLMIVADDAQMQQPAPAGSLHWVVMDARMNEVYAAAYRRDGAGRWAVAESPGAGERAEAAAGASDQADAGLPATGAPALYTLPALSACWARRAPTRIAGSALPAFGDQLPVGAALCLPREADRAAALARLTRQAWADGRAIDPAAALPLYLRDKVALTTEERRKVAA